MKKALVILLALLMLVSLCGTMLSCAQIADTAIDIIDTIIEDDGSQNKTEPDNDDYFIIDDEQQPQTDNEEQTDTPDILPDEEPDAQPDIQPDDNGITVAEDGEYDDRDHVALYLHTYGKLPSNYMTKKEAEKLGWSGGALDTVIKGKAIGGSFYGNYEGVLPKKKGREYHECDIDTIGSKSRGAKRIVYSNDGLIYYTDDHYETFTLLYGEE